MISGWSNSRIFINGKEVTDEFRTFGTINNLETINGVYTVKLHTSSFKEMDYCLDIMIDAQGFEHICYKEKGHPSYEKHEDCYATWGTFEIGDKGAYKELSAKDHYSNPYREYM